MVDAAPSNSTMISPAILVRQPLRTHLHRAFTSTSRLTMPADSDRPNASGLSPSQSRQLPPREPKADEEPILNALRELYTVNPSESSYAQYTQDAIFHDPVGIAKGIKSIRAQFNALPSLFPRAEIRRFNILDAPSDKLLIDQVVAYYREKDARAEPFKELNSLLTIEREAGSGLIKSHIEEWDHKAETDQEGMMGELHTARKTVSRLGVCRVRKCT